LSGIVTLVVSYYLFAQFTANVVAIIIALCSGYVVMFLLSSFIENKILAGHKKEAYIAG
jgi:hypothetical protein